ncbi:MAG: hypothetical protein AB7F43_04510 [Bacteriovoracia bacterium]
MLEMLLTRFRTDLKENFSDLKQQPFGGRRWDQDFPGEVEATDVRYAVFLGVVTMIPAAVIVFVSPAPQWKTIALFFAAPLQAVISGFLTSSILFLGSYVNKTPISYPMAFKVMLRVMAVFPLLRILSIHPLLLALGTGAYGFFVVRAAVKTLPISVRNAGLFFGSIYAVFTLLQLQAGLT